MFRVGLFIFLINAFSFPAQALDLDLGRYGVDSCSNSDSFFKFADTLKRSLKETGKIELAVSCEPGDWAQGGDYFRHTVKLILKNIPALSSNKLFIGELPRTFFYSETNGLNQNYYFFRELQFNILQMRPEKIWLSSTYYPDESKPGWCGKCDREFLTIEIRN